jgi:tetratricopeptide (TPR) repeat protein
LTAETKYKIIKYILLCFCILFPACSDFNCKKIIPGSSLRNYGPSDRIEKINKEIAILEKKDKEPVTRKRLGDLNEQLASIYMEKEDLDTTLFHVNNAFKYGRDNPYLNYLAGLVYGNRSAKTGSKDELDKAEKFFRQAVDMKKDYDDAWYSLAVLLFLYKNEREEPIKIIEKIVSRSRSNFRARFTLGRFYYESGRKEDALEIYNILQADLKKLPKSQMAMEYLKSSEENIQKIQDEKK